MVCGEVEVPHKAWWPQSPVWNHLEVPLLHKASLAPWASRWCRLPTQTQRLQGVWSSTLQFNILRCNKLRTGFNPPKKGETFLVTWRNRVRESLISSFVLPCRSPLYLAPACPLLSPFVRSWLEHFISRTLQRLSARRRYLSPLTFSYLLNIQGTFTAW